MFSSILDQFNLDFDPAAFLFPESLILNPYFSRTMVSVSATNDEEASARAAAATADTGAPTMYVPTGHLLYGLYLLHSIFNNEVF